MSIGNLSIKVSADISGFTSNMDIAARVAQENMAASAGAVDDFRVSLLRASAEMQKAALAMGGNMQATNDAIIASSEKAAEAVQSISDTADEADFESMGEKIAHALGVGVGVGIVAAQTAWDKFVEWTKAKAIVTGLVVGAIFAAVGLGAIYTAYKVISGSIGFIAGLINGDSYKSASIDALIAANDQVKEIQKSLYLTAQEASATNAAIATLGVNKADYTSVFTAAAAAMHGNTDELDRLGVKYKDLSGNILPLNEVVRNANDVLNQYTEGWDRNQAAAAIGLGGAEAVAAAASVTSAKIAEAADRLNDYNLGIGGDSQAAVARYEAAMLAFNRETELTASGFKRAWADQIMPALTDFAEFFKDGFPFAVNAFRYSMATVTSLFYGLKTVAYLVSESIVGSISAIGLGLGGVATAAMRVLSGDFSGAKDALVSGWTDAKSRLGQIGDNIVAQARHNADAMRQAWALDDRNAPGVAKAKGKDWKAKPEEEEEEDAAGPLDDVAKRIMEGKLKAQEDFIADEKTQLQTREQFLKRFYDVDAINAKDYYSKKQRLIADNLVGTLGAYDKEIAAVNEYIEVHKTESDKESDIVAANSKIAEIKRKRADAEVQANKDIALSYFDLANERDGIANSLLKSDAIENKSFGHRMSVLTAFRDAQLENEVEGNRLIEEETKRHTLAMEEIQNSRNMQALEAARSAASDLYGVMEKAGKEKTALGKSLFLAEKALAVAEIILNANSAASKAEGQYGPFGIPLATYLLATGYARAGIVAGTAIAGAFADGGDPPVGRPSLVGERGPELFVPKSSGTIIPNEMLRGGGGAMKLTIVNNTRSPIGRVTEQQISPTERALIIEEAVAVTASTLADPNSRMSRSMSRNMSVQRAR